MAAEYQSPSEYIAHHLTFFTKPVGDGAFWTLNVDSLIMTVILGIVLFGIRGVGVSLALVRRSLVLALVELVGEI